MSKEVHEKSIGDVTETATAIPGSPSVVTDQAMDASGPLPLVEVPIEYYVLEGEQGRGGIGIVIRARDRRTDRVVALKQLQSLAPESRLRFEREMRITARLQHPGVVPVHETGRFATGEPFYAMKLVQGRPLKELIAEKKTLDERLALLPHVLAVAETIAYAHNQGVIHRDLKPSNVIVGDFGETVVIDWGLAKSLDESTDPTSDSGPYRAGAQGDLTVHGQVLGTPAYMPPEQARGANVDATGDVYSIGAILYHLLVGAPPYGGGSSAELLRAVSAGAPVPVHEREPRVPADLAAVVNKAMQRVPAGRYLNAKGLADDLRRYQTGQLVAAHSYTQSELLLRWARAHRGALVVAAASLLILGAFAFVFVRRNIEARVEAEEQRRQAEAQRDLAQETRDAAILAQAAQSLAHDPTAAVAWAKTYPTKGRHRADIVGIAREAEALGTASFVAEEPSGLVVGAVFLGRTHRAIVLARDSADLWDVDSGKVLARRSRAFSDGPVGAARDKPYALFPSQVNVLTFVNAVGTPYFIDLPLQSEIRSYSISGDGSLLAYRLEDGTVWVARTEAQPLVPRLFLQLPIDRDGKHFAIIRAGEGGSHVLVARGGAGPLEAMSVESGAVIARMESGLPISSVQATNEDGWITLQTTTQEVYFTRLTPSGFEKPRLACKDCFIVAGGVLVPTKDGGVDAQRPDGVVLAHVGLDVRAAISIASTYSFSVVVAGLASGDVNVWPTNDPRMVRLQGHTAQVEALDISEDGRLLLTTSRDGKVRGWPIERSGVRTLTKHAAQAYTLVPVEHQLVSSGCDANVRVTDVDTGSVSDLLTGEWGCPIAQRLPDGRHVILSTDTGNLLILDPETKTLRKMNSSVVPYDDNRILAASENGRWIAANFERSLQVGLWRDEQLVALMPIGKSVTSLVFDAAKSLLVATGDGAVCEVGLQDFHMRSWTERGIRARRLLVRGQQVIVGTSDGQLFLLDLSRPGHPARAVASHHSRIDSLVEQDGIVIAAHRDGHLTTFSLAHPEEHETFRVCREAMGNLHGRAGQPLMVLCRDGLLKFVNIHTHEARVVKTANDAIVVSSTGDTAIIGDMDGRVTLWQIPSFDELHEFPGELESMSQVAVDQL